MIQSLEEVGTRKNEKVMVGRAPVTEAYAKKIGADGDTEDAISAFNLAFRLADAPK